MYYVLRMSSGNETEASQGLDVYIPMIRMRVFNRKNRVWQNREEVMFPGYGFIRVENPTEFRPAVATRFYCRLARKADRAYMAVTDEEIAALRVWERRVEEANQGRNNRKPMGPIEVGDAVSIKNIIRGIVVAVRGNEITVEGEGLALGFIKTDINSVMRTAH